MQSRLKKILESLWFQPSTPLIFLVLIGLGLYKFAYPMVLQKVIKPTLTHTAPTPTGNQVLGESTPQIIEQLQKLIDLPTDEEPEVVSITDVNKFKDQPFFKKAANGDKLLIYQKNKKAYLFDPKEHRVLDVAPITDASESARQLQQYCSALASQSAQIKSVPSVTPQVTPSATPSPSLQPTP